MDKVTMEAFRYMLAALFNINPKRATVNWFLTCYAFSDEGAIYLPFGRRDFTNQGEIMRQQILQDMNKQSFYSLVMQ